MYNSWVENLCRATVQHFEIKRIAISMSFFNILSNTKYDEIVYFIRNRIHNLHCLSYELKKRLAVLGKLGTRHT